MNSLERFLGNDSSEYWDTHFSEMAPRLLEWLISSLLEQEEADIGLVYQNGRVESSLTNDPFNSDWNVSIKLDKESVLRLHLFFYNTDGLLQEHDHILNSEEIKGIPSKLIPLMKEVLLTEKEMLFQPRSLGE